MFSRLLYINFKYLQPAANNQGSSQFHMKNKVLSFNWATHLLFLEYY